MTEGQLFRGRHRELENLERILSGLEPRTCSVLGRRRIGKTMLLSRFCDGKRALRMRFVRGPPETTSA